MGKILRILMEVTFWLTGIVFLSACSESDDGFTVRREDDVFIVEAEWLIPILAKTDLDDYESLQYLQRVIVSSGIEEELLRQGITEGDTVSIYDLEFEFVP